MTREFNNQGRDDARPSFRNQSSNRYGEERSPRPARPRLNRETVDRAWENGAPRVHGDYHPRNTHSNGPAPRNNWRNNQNNEYSSQNGPQGNRSYSYRQGPPRQNAPQRPFTGNPGTRPYDANNRTFNNSSRFDNQRGGNGSYGYNGDRGERPSFRSPSSNTPPYEQRDRGYSQRNSGPSRPEGRSFPPRGNNGPARPEGRGPRPSRPENTYGSERPQNRSNTTRDQANGFARRGAERHERNNPPKPYFDRNRYNRNHNDERPARPLNARAQSRMWIKQNQNEEPVDEQFEGDYEALGNDRGPRNYDRDASPRNYEDQRRSPRRPERSAPEELHVTRLPDGRVLKGSRPEQRKKAEFWNGVTESTDTLIGGIHPPQETEAEDSQTPSPSRRPVKRTASAVRRNKADKGAVKKPYHAGGPKPSQRGFKWPTGAE
ncbi:hypothetical protein [Tengunoibacter tsumagoiensis]|uniref:Uncharacterized protein n=1 Tax=Tengunoibacter tsumagoiensis TaxID=2014871 RepID=A0A401ZYH7_9CHLR|nr:hypothetical protein [Tengunoibacter tsumagoiensis]GCE11883.1 hypothetical protein KTT_17420 [Tengunoibacter tsumagoiensis]